MRRLARATLLAGALAAVMLVSTGAHAAEITGTVEGNVFLAHQDGSPGGLPITGCANTKYTFDGVIIEGLLQASNGALFAGLVDVSNTKGQSTICETTSAGAGTVNSSTDKATFSGIAGNGTISGTFFGTYCRTESLVHVDLTVSFSVNGGPTNTVPLDVDAQFTPTKFDPATSSVTEASFAGAFQSHQGTDGGFC